MIPPGRELITPSADLPRPADHRLALNPSTPISAPPPVDLAGLIVAFRRRWILASFGGLLVAAVVGLVVFRLAPPPKHTARALVQVSATMPRVIFQTSEEQLNFRTYQQTQIALIKSRKVLSAALTNPEVTRLKLAETHPDTLGWLTQELKADFTGGSEVLAVTLSGSDPSELSPVVNAVVDAYLNQIIAKEHEVRVARFDRLNTLFEKMQDELKERRKALRMEAESIGLSDDKSISTKQQLAMQFVATARQELLQLQNEIRRTEVEWKTLQAKTPPSVEVERLARDRQRFVDEDPSLTQLATKLAEKRTHLGRLRRVLSDLSDPSFRSLNQDIKQLEDSVEKRRRELQVLATRMQVEKTQPTPMDLVQDRLELLRAQEKTLAGQIDSIGVEVRSNTVKYLDMHWLEDEINLTSQAARTVGTEVAALKVELQAPPRVQPIEKAVLPAVTDPLRKYKMTVGAAGASLFLFVGLVTFLEFNTRRIGSSDEVVRLLGLRPMGVLPTVRVRQRRRSSNTDARLVESVDEMRTMILHASRAESLRSVMVVGAGKGEAKTTVSCHLAASLARSGRRTLLVDGDLRNPSVHRVLDLADGTGVCEILRGELTTQDVIRPSGMANLDILSAGWSDAISLQALASDSFGKLLRSLEDRYDFLIIDSAPVLLVSDTLMIAQQVDTVIFSILNQVSRMPMVRTAHDRLASLGVRILGAVVVGESRNLPSYSYEYQGVRGGEVTGEGANVA